MKRERFADLLRIAAALAVVIFHVMGSSVHNDPAVPAALADVLNRCKAMLGWPVPVFFMLTGYLWFRPGKECTFAKVLPNIRRFMVVLMTIGYAYALMERVFNAGTISLQALTLAFGDVLTGHLWDHMWYLYTAIGIYLVLPVLKPFFGTQNTRHQALLCLLLWCFSILAPFLEKRFGVSFPLDFPLTAHLFYVCTGGLIAHLSLSPKTGVVSALLFLLCCSLCAVTKGASLLTSLAAPALFMAFKGLSRQRSSSAALASLAQCAFGIYLFQQFYINLMLKALHIYPLRYPAAPAVIIASLLVFLFSLATTALLRRIPYVRKYLL